MNVHSSSCKVTINLLRFKKKKNSNFLGRILKKDQRANFMKIHPVGAELFLIGQTAGQTHGRTDGHDEANNSCSQFGKRP